MSYSIKYLCTIRRRAKFFHILLDIDKSILFQIDLALWNSFTLFKLKCRLGILFSNWFKWYHFKLIHKIIFKNIFLTILHVQSGWSCFNNYHELQNYIGATGVTATWKRESVLKFVRSLTTIRHLQLKVKPSNALLTRVRPFRDFKSIYLHKSGCPQTQFQVLCPPRQRCQVIYEK